jgi:hypothetical protein
MTNPAAAIRMLITYAVIIPLAAVVGYMLTNPLDYGTLGFFGLVALLLISPIIIKWHYPIMVFSLASPIYCFFLKGDPPLMQVAVMLSLGVAIIERTVNSDKRFISAPLMTWPLMFTLGVTILTAELTGGIGLKALGGEVSGGKKYVAIFIGIATFFALTSRVIPKNQRNLYVALFFLSGVLQFVSDLFPFLPAPLNYINLLIPPSGTTADNEEVTFGLTRLGSFAASAGVLANFMLAKLGLKGILRADRPGRFLLFLLLLVLTFLGGFRIVLVSYMMIGFLLFFLEGLYQTRLSLVIIMGGIICAALLVPFAEKLPFTFQRALTILPLKLDPAAVADAEGSKKWRQEIWADTWPKVPQYLLLGKGYALTALDFEMMGNGVFTGGKAVDMDKSLTGLAVSGDYHNGPLSTLVPFGIWGAIAFVWLSLTAVYVLYRNYKYGDPELKTVNTFLLVLGVAGLISFYFIFGAYQNDIGGYAKLAGFSIALNWGVCSAKREPAPAIRFKPLPRPHPLPV